LLIDGLEREDPTALDEIETPALVNLYTLFSDVQRGADDLRKNVGDVLLDRMPQNRPAHSQYGSVQRTTRRQRSLKDNETVLEAFEDMGIDREQVLGVDREKVDKALDVVPLSESAIYDITENEYVRKAEVDEERKETRLQGLKDRLAVSDDPEADVLRQEVERLMDDHVPIQSDNERCIYGQKQIGQMIAWLRESWSDDRFREVAMLAPDLEKKSALTRREGI